MSNTDDQSSFPAQVAGKFYSADAEQLGREVDQYLAHAAKVTQLPEHPTKAIIAPHAGHRFSGQYAAIAYHHLAQNKDKIRRVVMFGPAHKMAFEGMAVIDRKVWETPLGAIPIDERMATNLARTPFLHKDTAPFMDEHCLEVHLPFLQRCLGEFTLVPIIIGNADEDSITKLFKLIWQYPSAAIVVSTDLSHFHDYESAQSIDTTTRQAIERLDSQGLKSKTACGAKPVKGMLSLARLHGLRATTIAFGNSGDTGGNKDRVVGYGSWRFDEADKAALPTKLQSELINIAAQSIGGYGVHRQVPKLPKGNKIPIQLTNLRATFITLNLDGKLRGCIGTLQARRSLLEDVMANAIASAFRDPRFPELSSDEFAQLEISIAILGEAVAIDFKDEEDLLKQLQPGEDGLILTEKDTSHRATFLPAVWEKMASPTQFWQALKRKAGLKEDYWSDNIEVSRYRTEKFAAKVNPAIAAKFKW